MKPMLQVFFILAVYCFFSAATAFAASGGSAGTVTTKSLTSGAPLAEMLFYEAAEQAVEDGYARIIPDSEAKTADEGAAVEAEQGAVSSEVKPQNKE